MTTITINKRTKATRTLIDLATIFSEKNKNIVIDDIDILTAKKEKKARKAEKKKMIMELSKEVNKAMTKKLFEQYNMNYDSYNR